MDLLPLIKEVGFPVALCVVLIYAIKQQNSQLVKAFTDRIRTLEGVVEGQGESIENLRKESNNLQREMLRRADEYGHTLKDIAGRYAKVVTDHDAWSKQAFALLSRLIDVWQTRPCMGDRYDPHPAHPAQVPVAPMKTPSSAELPPPPKNVETDSHHAHR